LREGEQLRLALVDRIGHAQGMRRGARQKRIARARRAEAVIVGPGQDGGGERAQHRVCKRRDHDLGRQRHRIGVDRIGRKEGLALEDVVDPAREVGQRHRFQVGRELGAAPCFERRVDAQRRECLPPCGVGAQLRERACAVERRR
jgi:hypothetical protein